MSKVESNDRRLVENKIVETETSIYAYDTALIEDLRARLKRQDGSDMVNKKVQFTAPEDAMEVMGTLDEDTIITPFISIQRTGWNLNLDRQGYQTFLGELAFERIGPDNLPMEVRAQVIPITINWRMSVFTTDMITADCLLREILWYYHLRPTLNVKVPHGLNIIHNFNIYFNSDIENNSDIANFKNNGTLYRHDLTFYSDDCYLWKSRYDEKVAVYPEFKFFYGATIDFEQ